MFQRFHHNQATHEGTYLQADHCCQAWTASAPTKLWRFALGRRHHSAIACALAGAKVGAIAAGARVEFLWCRMVKWRRRGVRGFSLHFARMESTVAPRLQSYFPATEGSLWGSAVPLGCILEVCLPSQTINGKFLGSPGVRFQIDFNKVLISTSNMVCISFWFKFIEVQTAQWGLVNLLVGYSPPLHVAHLCINCAINWSTLWTFECLNTQTPPTPINV